MAPEVGTSAPACCSSDILSYIRNPSALRGHIILWMALLKILHCPACIHLSVLRAEPLLVRLERFLRAFETAMSTATVLYFQRQCLFLEAIVSKFPNQTDRQGSIPSSLVGSDDRPRNTAERQQIPRPSRSLDLLPVNGLA